jgi:LmbE family N-acetylglucosaminyl deacetylase
VAGGPGGTTDDVTRPDRILILAPHPDDEIVACGIAAKRAVSAGAKVCVLYLTTGVPPREALWPWQRPGYAVRISRRRDEAEAAAALIGLEPIDFLDIPSRRLKNHLDQALVEIDRAVAALEPEAIWVPAFEGAHQDHDAANALAARYRDRASVDEFAAYNFAGGQVSSNRFFTALGGETVISFDPSEIVLKRRALALYASERGNLAHIRVVEEAYRPLPAYDYAAPPHPGMLFRERFHWVPLRHPRVDFERSADIYRVLDGASVVASNSRVNAIRRGSAT